jgi:hypothetical protein
MINYIFTFFVIINLIRIANKYIGFQSSVVIKMYKITKNDKFSKKFIDMKYFEFNINISLLKLYQSFLLTINNAIVHLKIMKIELLI